MYALIARVRGKRRVCEYLQICETVRRRGKPTRCSLGPHKVDGLLRGLRRFAEREAAPGVRPAEAPILATRLAQRLAQAGLRLSAVEALEILEGVQAVDQHWGDTVVTHLTRPSPKARAILQAFGPPAEATILRTEPLPAA